MNAKKTAMVKALESSLGIVSTACTSVGISRQLHYDWIKADSEYRDAVKELDGSALDFAESALHGAMKNGSVPAIIFYLKCKGKKRGYSEHEVIEEPSTAPRLIQITFPEAKDPRISA